MERTPDAGTAGEGGITALRALLAAKPRPEGWAERRARIDEVGSTWPAASDLVREAVDAGGVEAEWSLAPGADTTRVLLFLHGGGYCSGSIASHRSLATGAGRTARMPALAVAYRRAPEHPYPAAVDDAERAWMWLRARGHTPDRIVVGGDSAGGGLTLALWQRLRSAGEPPPAALWLVSPWTDLTLSGASLDTKDSVDPLLHRAYLRELADAYLGAAGDPRDPLVSPLFADLTALPPTLVQVGTDEVLLDDAVRFTDAAAAAGADVTLHVWPRMIHAFPLWHGRLREGRAALQEFAAFADRHLAT